MEDEMPLDGAVVSASFDESIDTVCLVCMYTKIFGVIQCTCIASTKNENTYIKSYYMLTYIM